MTKLIREMIDKTIKTNQKISERTDGKNDIDEKLKILKSYYQILNNDKDSEHNLAKTYFIILYNFLIVERMFYDEVVAANKEINKNLKVEKLNSAKDVLKKFEELYDTHHIIRTNVETLDSIEPIRIFLRKRPIIFQKFIKK